MEWLQSLEAAAEAFDIMVQEERTMQDRLVSARRAAEFTRMIAEMTARRLFLVQQELRNAGQGRVSERSGDRPDSLAVLAVLENNVQSAMTVHRDCADAARAARAAYQAVVLESTGPRPSETPEYQTLLGRIVELSVNLGEVVPRGIPGTERSSMDFCRRFYEVKRTMGEHSDYRSRFDRAAERRLRERRRAAPQGRRGTGR